MTFCYLQNPYLKIKRSWGPKFPTNPDLSDSCHKAPSSSRCQICGTDRLTLIYIKGILSVLLLDAVIFCFLDNCFWFPAIKSFWLILVPPSDQEKLGSFYSEAFADGEFACTAYTGCWWRRDCDVLAGLFYKPHPLKAGLQLHGLFQLKIMLRIKTCQNYRSLEQILLAS